MRKLADLFRKLKQLVSTCRQSKSMFKQTTPCENSSQTELSPFVIERKSYKRSFYRRRSPKPVGKPHQHLSHRRVPAARHNAAIEKFMKGKGAKPHKLYRRMVAKHVSIRELEDN